MARAGSEQHSTNQTAYQGGDSTGLWANHTHQWADAVSKSNKDLAAGGKKPTNSESLTK